jgi:DNA repair protein REV1
VFTKFLGHGPCDLFSKQGPLIGPGGKATSDDQVIAEFAWRLLKSFAFDPKELRGIGIQITKLEPANAAPNIPAGQALLPFKRLEGISTSKVTGKAGPSHVPQNSAQAMPPPPLPEPTKQSNVLELPSFSQVDMSVFEALPPSLQQELKDEYSRRSETPGAGGAGPERAAGPSGINPPRPASPTKPAFNRRSATPAGLFPTKPTTKGINVKRITHQLAPNSNASISPQKSALYALLRKKPPKPVTSRVTEAKLRDLGIDPEVFAMLPKQVQDEQLVRARILKEKGTLPEAPTQRKVLKPKKPTLPPGFVVYRAPPPKARYYNPPALRQQGKSKKEKLVFTEADDVQNVLEKWVTAYKHWAPREKDVEYLSKFILNSVDGAKAGDRGVETAVMVMKWWLVLLRRFWAGSEFVDDEEDEDVDGSQVDHVGKAWWGTFRGVKAQMDVVARKRFGGCISLR